LKLLIKNTHAAYQNQTTYHEQTTATVFIIPSARNITATNIATHTNRPQIFNTYLTHQRIPVHSQPIQKITTAQHRVSQTTRSTKSAAYRREYAPDQVESSHAR